MKHPDPTSYHLQGVIRESYYAGIGVAESHILAEEGLSGAPLKQAHNSHIGHCFDYLRQALMCCGDMTIEGAKQSQFGNPLDTVDGWGIAHQCRSWDTAFAWVSEHKALHNSTSIA